jgi:hypothetical protein
VGKRVVVRYVRVETGQEFEVDLDEWLSRGTRFDEEAAGAVSVDTLPKTPRER